MTNQAETDDICHRTDFERHRTLRSSLVQLGHRFDGRLHVFGARTISRDRPA
jgi:hypothetical protein